MIWFECLEFSPRGWDVIVQVISTLFAPLRKEIDEAVQVRHERLDRHVWVHGRLEVQHGRVRVLRDPLEDLVFGLGPHIHLTVDTTWLFIEALDNHPLNHEALEDEHGLEDAVQGDLDNGMQLGTIGSRNAEIHVTKLTAKAVDQCV